MKRPDLKELNHHAYKALVAVSASTRSLDPKLKALMEVRVSQMNGCAFCLDMHAAEARRAGETQQRLDCLAGWRDYPFFTERERAALAWAEAVTDISVTHAPDEVYQRLAAEMSEQEIVDLTVGVAAINAWNRLMIATRKVPAKR